jgi:hypothetical protein
MELISIINESLVKGGEMHLTFRIKYKEYKTNTNYEGCWLRGQLSIKKKEKKLWIYIYSH